MTDFYNFAGSNRGISGTAISKYRGAVDSYIKGKYTSNCQIILDLAIN